MKSILIVQMRFMGDIILSTPLLRLLRQKYPASKISVVVLAQFTDLLKNNPDIDRLYAYPKKPLRQVLKFLYHLRRENFDLVIDLSYCDRSALLTRVTGAPERIGYNDEYRLRGAAYTKVVPPHLPTVHRVFRNLRAIEFLGVYDAPGELRFCLSEEDRQSADTLLESLHPGLADPDSKFIMIQPGARALHKTWPIEFYADLVNRLIGKFSLPVIIGGSANETDLCKKLVEQCTQRPIEIAGKTSVGQYAGILARCSLLIGNDSGPMHLAAALGIPAVALFGPTSPAEWGPWNSSATIFQKKPISAECGGRRCQKGETCCIRQITVKEVFDEAAKIIGS